MENGRPDEVGGTWQAQEPEIFWKPPQGAEEARAEEERLAVERMRVEKSQRGDESSRRGDESSRREAFARIEAAKARQAELLKPYSAEAVRSREQAAAKEIASREQRAESREQVSGGAMVRDLFNMLTREIILSRQGAEQQLGELRGRVSSVALVLWLIALALICLAGSMLALTLHFTL